MNKYKYQINDKVYAFDQDDWVIPGTVTVIDNDLYYVEYDNGGSDWLICDELKPLEYKVGHYVNTMIGVGVIKHIDSDYGLITVSYGKIHAPKRYYEFEISPVKQPSLLTRLLGKGTYLYT